MRRPWAKVGFVVMTLAMLGRVRKSPLFKTTSTLLYPLLLQVVLVTQSAWMEINHMFIATATLEQCKLDCTGNTTVDLQTQARKNGRYWSIWDTQRLVGPTEPAPELNATYPYARAPLPLPCASFCQLGCSFFFSSAPQNTTCCALCDDVYARNVSVGISDYAEKVYGKPRMLHIGLRRYHKMEWVASDEPFVTFSLSANENNVSFRGHV